MNSKESKTQIRSLRDS